MERVCQSCGIPLRTDILGTEKKHTRSKEYCKFCYKGGHFIQKELTFYEMKKIGLRDISQSNNFILLKWFMMLVYPIQLRRLKRWRVNK